MEYEDSFNSGIKEEIDADWADDVHIRKDYSTVQKRAVFDGKEQVSVEYPPTEDTHCIDVASSYSRGKRNGEFAYADSYEEREALPVKSLVAETVEILNIVFENIEYLLGNAEFQDTEINFEKLESAYNALSEIIQFIDQDEFESLERR